MTFMYNNSSNDTIDDDNNNKNNVFHVSKEVCGDLIMFSGNSLFKSFDL